MRAALPDQRCCTGLPRCSCLRAAIETAFGGSDTGGARVWKDGTVGITAEEGTLNVHAKSAARSAFKSNKQRLFNHLITAMKYPTVIKSIAADVEAGHAGIVQIASTSEALMERWWLRCAH